MIEIREARLEDLPKLHAGALEFYASTNVLHHFRIDKFIAIWTHLIGVNQGVVLIAEDKEVIQGSLGGMVHPDIYGDETVAEEFFWFVRPDHRGCGLALYRRFEEWARSRNADTLHMVHLLDLMPEKVAVFYKRAGFAPIETRYAKSL